MEKKVVVCGMPGINRSDIDKLEIYLKEECPEGKFEFLGEDVIPKEELLEKIKGAQVLVSWDQEMDDDLYQGSDLRAYCAASIGFNAANIKSATRSKVLVTNCDGYCIDEVATHTLMLILDCARKNYAMIPYVKEGNWDLSILGDIKQFAGSTVGLYGFGNIPKSVAKKLSGFDVNVIAADPFVSQEEMATLGVEKVELDQLLAQSDYISLHAPLVESTKHVINRESLKKVKPTAYLINTARGGLVNYDHLYEALTSAGLQGAALDVLANEPPTEEDRKIIDLPNTVVTAHCAYLSTEAADLQIRMTAQAAANVLKGKLPENIKNREIIGDLKWVNP